MYYFKWKSQKFQYEHKVLINSNDKIYWVELRDLMLIWYDLFNGYECLFNHISFCNNFCCYFFLIELLKLK